MSPHPLTSFKIQKYYQKESRLNGAQSRNNFPKIKYGTYVINLDDCKSVGTHWIALYENNDNVTHFYYFGVEYIPKGIKKFKGNKNITTNIYRTQHIIQ